MSITASSSRATRPQKRGRSFSWDTLLPYGFIAPFFILVGIFSLYVFGFGARISLTDMQGLNPGTWVGLDNFSSLVSELLPWNWGNGGEFLRAMRITFVFAGGCLITQVPAAFLIAVFLNGVPKYLKALLRSAFFIPVLINSVVIAFIFQNLFNKDIGMINWILGKLGMTDTPNWLFDSSYTMWVMIIVAFWQWTGYHMVYFLAYLQSIDPALYEAAKIDGASAGRILWSITLPAMRPAITYVMITQFSGAMLVFEYPFLLFPNTPYGPGSNAMAIVPFIFNKAFSSELRLGYATAAGWVLFLVVLGISLIQMRVLGLGSSDEE